MKMLVTGATGFLGQKAALRLHEQGHEVTALGRNERMGRELTERGLRFVKADLAERGAIVDACAEQDYVFHSGALSSPWGNYDDFYRANVTGTANVIAGCREHGVKRLIHVSTPSLYFDWRDRLNIGEAEPLPVRGVNHYAATKRLAEDEVDRAFQAGLSVCRFARGPSLARATPLFPRLIRVAERGALPIFGDGSNRVDLTYVDNVVDAMLLCQTAPERVLGRKYNITNGEPRPIIELLEQTFRRLDLPFRPLHVPFGLAFGVAAAMELFSFGQEPLLTTYAVGLLAKNQTLDITAAREDLGYRPRVSIDDGLEAFANWWKEGRHAG